MEKEDNDVINVEQVKDSLKTVSNSHKDFYGAIRFKSPRLS